MHVGWCVYATQHRQLAAALVFKWMDVFLFVFHISGSTYSTITIADFFTFSFWSEEEKQKKSTNANNITNITFFLSK